MSIERTNGKPLEGKIWRDANSIPIAHSNGARLEVNLAVGHAPQKDISELM